MTVAAAHAAVRERTERWLGDLPGGWRGARLCEVAAAWPSNVDKHTVEDQLPVRLCNYTHVYKNSRITADLDFMRATATAKQVARFRLREGDTLITKDSETADDIGVPAFVDYEADDLVCGYHLALVRPRRDRVAPRFLYWILASEPVRRQWSVLASGVTRFGLRSSDLDKVTVPLPSLMAQESIADFLDRETAQIDALIAEQERFIELLKERKGAALQGLAEWVGRGDRLKWVLREVDVRAGEAAAGLPLLSVSIDWGVRRRSDFTQDPPRAEELTNYKVCGSGDVVVNRMRAFQGALGRAPEDGLVSPDYAVFRVLPTVDSRWLASVMRTSAFVSEIVVRLRGIGGTASGVVRTPRINADDLLQIRIAHPSLTEQRDEYRQIQDRIDDIEALMGKTREHIALARERRGALITAAVTGQIDVTGREA